MGNITNEQAFENWKLIHNFYYDNEPIKKWIDKDNFIDTFADWNSLMPVIQECLVGECDKSIEINKTTIQSIYDGICNQHFSEAKKSVIEYIKWYNGQEKK
jgi:hypothetical protein